MAALLILPHIRAGLEVSMFVGLGFVLMVIATYGLFAWQLSLGRIATLCVAGILLMLAQFLRLQKEPAIQPKEKGEFHGSR